MLYSVFTYEPCWAFIFQFSLIIIYPAHCRQNTEGPGVQVFDDIHDAL